MTEHTKKESETHARTRSSNRRTSADRLSRPPASPQTHILPLPFLGGRHRTSPFPSPARGRDPLRPPRMLASREGNFGRDGQRRSAAQSRDRHRIFPDATDRLLHSQIRELPTSCLRLLPIARKRPADAPSSKRDSLRPPIFELPSRSTESVSSCLALPDHPKED